MDEDLIARGEYEHLDMMYNNLINARISGHTNGNGPKDVEDIQEVDYGDSE